ncbi:hypothetical protein KP509_18G039800 [Ceratopteris richardii]|uniref:Uncharacterized protein n=1 Tax=Ceratopteris richardii TaxID=49495 RepID=A0A8T2SQI0_CERRI|nr:hypothetical protein KP509_18G039800 [Ceratopteris richardii]
MGFIMIKESMVFVEQTSALLCIQVTLTILSPYLPFCLSICLSVHICLSLAHLLLPACLSPWGQFTSPSSDCPFVRNSCLPGSLLACTFALQFFMHFSFV